MEILWNSQKYHFKSVIPSVIHIPGAWTLKLLVKISLGDQWKQGLILDIYK